MEPKSLLEELPSFIKNELILFSNSKFVEKIKIFKLDMNFTVMILP